MDSFRGRAPCHLQAVRQFRAGAALSGWCSRASLIDRAQACPRTAPILSAAARTQIQRDVRPPNGGRTERRKAHLVAGLRLEKQDDLVGLGIDQLTLAGP